MRNPLRDESATDEIATLIQLGKLNGESSHATAEKVVLYLTAPTANEAVREIALEASSERE